MRKVSAFALAAATLSLAVGAAAQATEQPPPETEKDASGAPQDSKPGGSAPAEAAAEAETGTEAAATGAAATPAAPADASPATSNVELAPSFPNPAADADAIAAQGAERPEPEADENQKAQKKDRSEISTDTIFAEDWWSHTRPIFEIHGLFRTRAEAFWDFDLGRIDAPDSALWAPPADNYYESNGAPYGPRLCEGGSNPIAGTNLGNCDNSLQAGANLNFILRPELHVSDNVRVMSEFRFLNNLRLGSTPAGYGFGPAGNGYQVQQPSGYYSNGVSTDTQTSPISGVNSLNDAVQVTRVWGEYTTPVGEIRFGRMPHHWGLGMLYNAGNGFDDDYYSTIDRITFITGLKPLDLVVAGSWDFPNEGPGGSVAIAGAPEYDLAQSDDVGQLTLTLMRKVSPELTQLALSKGNIVFNIGTYLVYRHQTLANDTVGDAVAGANVPDASREQLSTGFSRRSAEIFTPDLWLQLLYKKFRFEAEAALVIGKIGSTTVVPDNGDDFRTEDARRNLLQFGMTTQIEQTLLEDRLHLDFNFGYATGDASAFDASTVGDLVPGPNEQQVADKNITTFRFHPSYQVDLILNRNLLGRVQGSYYFKPSVAYDFIRDPAGQRAGGRAAAIWTRASEFMQTPGHEPDLGIELNGTLYYQSKDGALNDDPNEMGGFYTMIQYGVLFPLGGLGYQSRQIVDLGNPSTTAAQILRWYLGVLF